MNTILEVRTMGAKRIIGIVLVILGALGLIVFLLADVLGYGRPGFGIRQIIGTIAGGVTVIVGLILLLLRR
jgi:hypothetical protein